MTNPDFVEQSKEELLEKCRLEQEQAQLRDFKLSVHMDLISLLCLVGSLQLALRHPANTGPCATILRGAIKQITERLTEEGYPANAELMLGSKPAHDDPAKPQRITDADLIERLGGIENTQAAPTREIGPHPFYAVKSNRKCGRCGGGLLHPVHETGFPPS